MPRADKLNLLANALEVDANWLAALDVRMPIVSTEPWDPETMGKETDPSIVLINRVLHACDRQVNKRLSDMILWVLREDFDENGNKRK